ncbi:threonine aldolase family protein [Pseudoteredinibacter isoporae]|uniref:Threonine aldolase n=1 Tax=Pseudoteredinibacter isoporae TaxID=570281 RepID=A0A7X0JPJ1_9GAMM|nr:beta-eliminating lyase-related protein [Pseudoteredinibacter isoporae]MBB6519877.1 threonine aldolase [Pseudoteredinibacter isoporae]NHO85455.1 hypothetical protein [Pseudoteredinibacter isoporae]NIB26093.1 hypothetical protein [Pseudoteredinibacter isoporae]
MYDGLLLGHPLMSKCTRFVTRHRPLSQRQWLERIQQVPEIDLDIDLYNSGASIEILERRMAELLGKEKALFVPKGSIGQYSALLQWAQNHGSRKLALHPQSHFQCDESMAYETLLGFEGVMFGKPGKAIDSEDIRNLPEDVFAATVELPLRRAGFKLPEWPDLVALKQRANDSGIALHIDGARLFESADYWGKSYQDVSALGDSVYVSLYKTLGAAAGGIIAGDKVFVEQLMTWRSRLGGDLFTAFPYVLSALWGLEHYLPRVSEFNQRAQSLSKLIVDAFGESAIPEPVQSNGFLVQLPVSASVLKDRALQVAESDRVWLFDRVFEANENNSRFEIQIGDAMDDWSDQEFVETLQALIR